MLWKGIEEFLAVVDAGSFTAGADSLGVSKSFVSKMVNELESRVGAKLLSRSTRHLSLTAAGTIFYKRCLEVRDSLADIERKMTQFQEKPMGRLRIGLSDTFGVTFMSALIADFSVRHPEISVEIVAYLRDNDIVQETFDVVIRYGRLADSSMKARPLGYLSYCLCASPQYFARRGKPASVTELSDHDCLTDLSGYFRLNSDEVDRGRVKLSGSWKSNSGIALAAAARHGLGIAQIPISVIHDDLNEGHLESLEHDWSFYDKEVWAVFSPGLIPAATRALIDHLAAAFEHTKLRPWMTPELHALVRLARSAEDEPDV